MCPRSRRRLWTWVPMKPDPPVIRIFIIEADGKKGNQGAQATRRHFVSRTNDGINGFAFCVAVYGFEFGMWGVGIIGLGEACRVFFWRERESGRANRCGAGFPTHGIGPTFGRWHRGLLCNWHGRGPVFLAVAIRECGRSRFLAGNSKRQRLDGWAGRGVGSWPSAR